MMITNDFDRTSLTNQLFADLIIALQLFLTNKSVDEQCANTRRHQHTSRRVTVSRSSDHPLPLLSRLDPRSLVARSSAAQLWRCRYKGQ